MTQCLLPSSIELHCVSQKLNTGFVHACEAYKRQSDMKEQLSSGMCEGGGDQNNQFTVKEG